MEILDHQEEQLLQKPGIGWRILGICRLFFISLFAAAIIFTFYEMLARRIDAIDIYYQSHTNENIILGIFAVILFFASSYHFPQGWREVRRKANLWQKTGWRVVGIIIQAIMVVGMILNAIDMRYDSFKSQLLFALTVPYFIFLIVDIYIAWNAKSRIEFSNY